MRSRLPHQIGDDIAIRWRDVVTFAGIFRQVEEQRRIVFDTPFAGRL